MPKRTCLFIASFLVLLLVVANGVVRAQTNGDDKPNSRPVGPNSPAPLQPLGAAPSGPTPAGPYQMPAAFYPVGPTAEQDSVMQRPRPEFQPNGFELGTLASKLGLIDEAEEAGKRSGLSSMVVFPKLAVGATYDSNIFRTKDETSDRILMVAPSVSIRSDWAKHALEIYGSADIARYDRTKTEDYQEYLGRLSGRADLYDNFSVHGLVQYGQQHQPRGELIDSGDTTEATVIETGRARLGADLELAALTLSAAAEAITSNFVSDGTVDNDDLDNNRYNAELRLSHEIDTGTSIFVQPKYNRRDYNRKVDASGFEQDSHGYEILGGLRWDASGVTFVEVGLGYLWQLYDESRFNNIEGGTASVQAIWNFSELWTLTLGLARTVSETADQDLSGVLNTRVNSRLDYEFLYNTLFSLRFEFGDEDYKSSSRSDNRTRAGLGIKHLFNRHLFAEFDIGHEKLSSNRDDEDFKATTGMLRLGAQY